MADTIIAHFHRDGAQRRRMLSLIQRPPRPGGHPSTGGELRLRRGRAVSPADDTPVLRTTPLARGELKKQARRGRTLFELCTLNFAL